MTDTVNSAPSDVSPQPAAPRCPTCGRTLATGERSCVDCERTVGPQPAVDAQDDRVCAACGIRNVSSRILCASCGVDLDRMDRDLVVSPFLRPLGTSGPDRATDDSSGARWWVPVLAVLAVVGGVTAALAWLGLGPFAEEQDLPTADFRDDAYPDEPAPIALSDVATVTSAAPQDGRQFTPANLVDDDPETAWRDDASRLPPGTDEKIDLFLERPAWVVAVVVDNGDHHDAAAYAASARAQGAELVFDGDVRVPVTLLDQGRSPQIIPLDEPVLTASVRLEVTSVFPGTERTDVALTRIELLGHEANDEDAEVARAREDAMPAAGVIVLPE